MDIKDITYYTNQGVINPPLMGVLVEPPDCDFILEKTTPIPIALEKIRDMVENNHIEGCNVVDFSTESGVSIIDYSRISFEPISKVYSFFCIECDAATDITFTIESIARQRVWVNTKLFSFCCIDNNEKRPIYTLTLKSGRNIFCIEQHEALDIFRTTIVITTFKYESEKKYASVIYNNYYYEKGKIIVAFNMDSNNSYSALCYDKDFFEFTIAPIDLVNLSDETMFDINVIETITQRKMLSMKAVMYENIVVPIEKLRYDRVHPLQHLHFTISYTTVDGEKKEFGFPLNIYKPKEYIYHVSERAKRILADGNLSGDATAYIQYNLTNAYRYDETAHRVFYTWCGINETLDMIEAGEYDRWLLSEGIKKQYYLSRLDGIYIEYYISLPKNFNPHKKYPLLIWTMYDNSTDGIRVQYFKDIKDIIVVSIHGRGMTFSSYVGDAAMRENIDDILKRYDIDRDRIYVIGQCSGGYSAWSLITKTPSFFAAAYPSSSYFFEPELRNLKNMKLYSLTSEVTGAYSEFQKRIGKYDLSEFNFTVIYVPKYYTAVEHLILDKNVIADIINTKREFYPDKISYRTYMNRYRKAYWITIHSVQYGEKYGAIEAEIKDGEIIVTTENISGFSIETPPQITSDVISIVINGYKVHLKRATEYSFVFENGVYKEFHGEIPGCKKYKGTGLIDVYLDPLKLINCIPCNEISKNTVEVLSHPVYNTSGGGCSVNYQIISAEELSYDIRDPFFSQSSFVILDVNSKGNAFVDSVRRDQFIKMNEYGYTYLGNEFEGDYVVMQILSNPCNNDMSILYVNTNNVNLLSKHFFCRKMILPTYNNGFHPFLNNEALIFDGKRYLAILENGMPVEEIGRRI